jgi:hypothetical protein
MIDYPAVLVSIRPGAQWTLNGSDYSGLIWHDDTEPPTQGECDAAWPQVEYEREYARVATQRRFRYQAETDGLFFEAQREGGDLTVWQAAVDAIKAELPYPTAP